MRKRRVILIAVTCLVAVVVAFLVWPGEREPVYQGRKLSEWIDQHIESDYTSLEGVASATAVRAIGTNALPSLLDWVRYGGPRWKLTVYSGFRKLPRALKLRAVESFLVPKGAFRAICGFHLLGTNSSLAIPDLVRIARDPRDGPAARRAMTCLFTIGGGAEEEVKRIIVDGDPLLREGARDVVSAHENLY